jgi:hypothetical protein
VAPAKLSAEAIQDSFSRAFRPLECALVIVLALSTGSGCYTFGVTEKADR